MSSHSKPGYRRSLWTAAPVILAFILALAFMPLPALARPPARQGTPRPTGGDQTQATRDATVWYLAEGYTGGEFDTWVLVQNPGEENAKVTLSFQLPPGSSAPDYKFDLPGGTRKSIHLDELQGLGGTDVSTKVVGTNPVVAERAMYFNYNGKVGGHDSIGVKYPSANWFLAEGYTGGEFDTYVLVQNPNSAPTSATLDFQLPPGSSAPSYTFDLPARTRKTVRLDDLPGLAATDVSTKVSSPLPVVAERAMYFNYYGITGGHDSIGAENPSKSWFLAEGYTGGTFDTWVLVQNPGNEAANVTLDFQLPPGSSAPSYTFDLPAGTRKTVRLDDLSGLAATDVSTMVSASKPVVAERAEYFDYYGRSDGHDSIGVTRPDTDWYLAEGYTAESFDTYLLVQNPGKTEKKVTLHFQLPPGAKADPYSFTLPGGTRRTVHLDELPGLKGTDVSTWVDASGPVVAERSMYFYYDGKKGGSCSSGALYEPPVIPATTKVLIEDDMKHLIDEHVSKPYRVLTFHGETANLKNVEVGDVLVSNVASGQLPPSKVGKISHSEGNLLLYVEAAGIEEAIWRGRMSLANTQAANAGGADRAASSLVHLTHTFNVSQRIGGDENYVQLNGSATVTFDADLSVNIDYTAPSVDSYWKKSKWGISYLVVDVKPPKVVFNGLSFGATFSENIGITATTHGNFAKSKFVTTIPGTRIDLPSIDFVIGVVPGWIDPYIQLALGADGAVHASVTAGVRQDATIGAGASYNTAEGWKTTKSNTFSYEFTPPTATGTFDCKFSLGPQIGLLLYSIAGPYINLLPGFRVTADSNGGHPGHPLWALYVDLDIDLGVKVGIQVGILKWSWTYFFVNEFFRLPTWEALLVKSVHLYSITPTSGAVDTPVTLNGNGFGDQPVNNSYVSFGNTNVTSPTSWNDDTIVCNVPSGVLGTVDVSVTRVFWNWVIGGVQLPKIEQTSDKKSFEVTGPPPPSGAELLTNGDFSNNLSNWSIWDQGGSNVHGDNRLEVKTVGGRRAVFMYRRCPQNDGGASGIIQQLNASLAGATSLRLTSTIRADYQRGGAIAGSNPAWFPEGAVQFRFKYRKADGSEAEWYHGFYYGSVSGADTAHFTKVSKDSWYDYDSGNILSEVGAGSTITDFRAYGFGWDFDGYASGISLKKT